MDFLAQAEQSYFWRAASGSSILYLRLAIGVVLGIALIVALMKAPTRSRKYIVGAFTFLAGLIYVAFYFWPKPSPSLAADEIPANVVESGADFLAEMVNLVAEFSTILTGFLLGLGIFSLVRIHSTRLMKKQANWFYSMVLLVCLFGIMIIGLVSWANGLDPKAAVALADRANWSFWEWSKDVLFDGLLQEMDAAFFSIIAFYILSAAYRAFRIRSIEATILLAAALIVMLALMGAVEYQWGAVVDNATDKNPDSFLNNFKLLEIRNWLGDNVQNASIRAVKFGIGIGALAMGLRLWLSLERGGVRS